MYIHVVHGFVFNNQVKYNNPNKSFESTIHILSSFFEYVVLIDYYHES